jgi:hypothetical protein
MTELDARNRKRPFAGLFPRNPHLSRTATLTSRTFDLSSFADTDEQARRNIRDAVRGFLAASADMGTLGEILKEAGHQA